MTVLEVNRDITDLKRTLQHLRFLTEASKLLVSSLNYKEVLVQVAQRAVPMVADWCRVDLLREDGTLYPLIITHVDPEKVAWAYQLSEATPYDPDAPTGVAAVMRTKTSEFFPSIPDDLLAAAAKDEQELALIRSIGLSSAITVPLVVQEQGIGAITLVTTETKRITRRPILLWRRSWRVAPPSPWKTLVSTSICKISARIWRRW